MRLGKRRDLITEDDIESEDTQSTHPSDDSEFDMVSEITRLEDMDIYFFCALQLLLLSVSFYFSWCFGTLVDFF